MIQIPMFSDPCFSQDVVLDTASFHMAFHWNSRGEFWVLDMYDRDQNLLVGGIRLVNNYEHFGCHPDRGFPDGKLFVIDSRGTSTDIAYDDFTNGNCSLIFMTTAEYEALNAAV